MKLGVFPVDSLDSRPVVHAQLKRAEQDPRQVLRIQIIHVGLNDKEPLLQPQTIPWRGGVTEIVHVAGSSS